MVYKSWKYLLQLGSPCQPTNTIKPDFQLSVCLWGIPREPGAALLTAISPLWVKRENDKPPRLIMKQLEQAVCLHLMQCQLYFNIIQNIMQRYLEKRKTNLVFKMSVWGLLLSLWRSEKQIFMSLPHGACFWTDSWDWAFFSPILGGFVRYNLAWIILTYRLCESTLDANAWSCF